MSPTRRDDLAPRPDVLYTHTRTRSIYSTLFARRQQRYGFWHRDTTERQCGKCGTFSPSALHFRFANFSFSRMKYVPSDGFFGIQILPNSISAGAQPRSTLWELTTLPQTSSQLGRGTPPPTPHPHRASPLFKTFCRP